MKFYSRGMDCFLFHTLIRIPQLLTPATADDLQIFGKVSLSPTLTIDSALKALHVKVPVVATITQNFDENGKQSFSIEAPGMDQNQGK